MVFTHEVSSQAAAMLRDVAHVPFWLDSDQRPSAGAPLRDPITADLTIVGAGFSGLWTAYLASQRHPELDIVVLEGGRIAGAATGRNGGFVAASLTHGFANGMSRWPQDMPTLHRLGMENLEGIITTIAAEGIDCDMQRSGEIDVAVADYQVDALREMVEVANSIGAHLQFLTADELRAKVNSPTYLGGAYDADGVVMLDPARLAWGLAAALKRKGVRIYEHTPVRTMSRLGSGMVLGTDHARVRTGKVALATSAYPPLLKRLNHYVVPVYDSVLMTEPLSPAQRADIGWSGREGVSDAGNQFHYYRMSEDGRILWGGYDASYYGDMGPHRENNPVAFGRLAAHFEQTFPQLDGLRFTHAWAGAIDTCSRFSAFWGTAYENRLAYSVGFTGLGVGASRFGAQVMLDLLWQENTERTRLEMVRSKPIPFPPRPLRDIGISLTRRAINAADNNEGHRNLWLRTLDKVGLGFDS